MAPMITPWMGDSFSLTMRFLVGVLNSCGGRPGQPTISPHCTALGLLGLPIYPVMSAIL